MRNLISVSYTTSVYKPAIIPEQAFGIFVSNDIFKSAPADCNTWRIWDFIKDPSGFHINPCQMLIFKTA
ncbi:hypothetical protein [Schaedlerella arabinosiphila]|jgi:hypothetical protein|uniref:hypothetical protein n=1 Tax=Schaedlerella arabinosiphila TaxID=2044587 RepID=UPI0011CF3261|nr:hypothetical protein [Schaedlerella arabinosiphila]